MTGGLHPDIRDTIRAEVLNVIAGALAVGPDDTLVLQVRSAGSEEAFQQHTEMLLEQARHTRLAGRVVVVAADGLAVTRGTPPERT